MSARGDKYVRGLDVAVDDSFGVCRIECVRNLNPQLQHLLERQRLAGNAVLQRLAVEKLHRDELLAVLLADVVNGADVRVIQRRSRLRFAAEAFQRSGIVEHFVGQEFQRHRAMESRVLGLVNDTHPTTTELLEDAVV